MGVATRWSIFSSLVSMLLGDAVRYIILRGRYSKLVIKSRMSLSLRMLDLLVFLR